MRVTFKFDGGRELHRRLASLDAKIERNIGKKAIRAGASEYAKLVRKQIPMNDENNVHLKRSVGVSTPKRSANKIRVQVGVKGAARRYAHIFEFGSKFVQGTRIFTKTLQENKERIMAKVIAKMRAELAKV